MTDVEWVKERAELTVSNAECGAQLEVTDKELRDSFVRNTVVALQAAITRTREAERALAAEALKLALQMQVEAIERERTISKMEAEVAAVPVDEQEAMKAKARSLAALKAEANHFDMGRESVIARLKNPDEALIEAVGAYLMDPDKRIGAKWADIHPEIRDGYAYEARGAIRALAATLDKEE